MGKVRVHELAKEFGLENKEVVQKLQQAGLSVKTHSSTVYEDEARAILGKKTDDAKPATRRRPGMMIVRKRDKAPEKKPAETPSEATAEAQAAQSSDDVAATATSVANEAPSDDAAAPPSQAPADQVAATQQPATPPAPEPEVAPEPASELAAAGEAPAVSHAQGGEAQASPEAEAPAEPAAEDTTPVAAEAATAESEQQASAHPQPAGKAGKDKKSGAQIVGQIDREKLLERVPGGRLGDESAARGQRYGQVTELRVVNDPFGQGRQMIQVGKDKKGAGKAGAKRKQRTPSKRETMERYERSMHPSRLRKKKKIKKGAGKKTEVTQPKASKRVVKMKETIILSELAQQMGVKATELVRKLMGMGMMVTQNQSVDFDTAQLLAADYEYTVESTAFREEEVLQTAAEEQQDESNLEVRPPVVTVMGHVDHGKTSLLDMIRKTRVVAKEAGGITQHIGAYQVDVPKKGAVTFLDTPGHAAFTAMRARGAEVTDIVVLVVAADDGVMPQTEEAIKHAQAAGCPIIVAVNKIDRPEANPDRVTQELTKFNLVPEEWGGDTLYVQTSAIKGQGLEELLEAILLQAEVMEYKANPNRNAVGVVVEAQLDKGRGPVATLLVQQGTLKRGAHVVVGEHAGRIRAMTNDRGQQVKEAGPSTPVEVIGLGGVPAAGDQLHVVESEKQAKEVAAHRATQREQSEAESKGGMSLDELMARMKGEEATELKIVLKADVQGSVEAVKDAISQLSAEDVRVNVIYSGVGAISESDIMLASASEGLVLGFNVRPASKARRVAEDEGVEVRTYTVIYEMVEDIQRAMEGLLAPETQEKVVGRADVREVFRVAKVGAIAGCRVLEGKAMRNARVRLLRDNVQMYDGKVGSLKRFKDDVREVEQGFECGVSIDGYNDIKEGDVLEFYRLEEVSRGLASRSQQTKPGAGVEAHP